MGHDFLLSLILCPLQVCIRIIVPDWLAWMWNVGLLECVGC